MNIMIFDTETTSIEKPFVYDIGYVIFNIEEGAIVAKRSYIVTNVWHNLMLFTTAYYADKRAHYEQMLSERIMVKHSWEWIVNKMLSDIEGYEITDGYAFSSGFDDGVFKYNADWFKTTNPLDNVRIHDIRGYVHKCLAFTADYQAFCDKGKRYTESGNYSTTAETVYQYLTANSEFIEAHTALEDSLIEGAILAECVHRGAEWNEDYKVYQSIPRHEMRIFKVEDAEGVVYEFPFTRKRKMSNDEGVRLTIKGAE